MFRVGVDELTHVTCESDLTHYREDDLSGEFYHFVVHDLSSDVTRFLSEFAQHWLS